MRRILIGKTEYIFETPLSLKITELAKREEERLPAYLYFYLGNYNYEAYLPEAYQESRYLVMEDKVILTDRLETNAEGIQVDWVLDWTTVDSEQ
ncbi:hypothetical protein [Algivirga pacifica]|uniref:Uncharacterized protein n=1 Tax=Algivirga pacifica TaxID=1162670 RepID=A0ABP9D2Z5_9BACT